MSDAAVRVVALGLFALAAALAGVCGAGLADALLYEHDGVEAVAAGGCGALALWAAGALGLAIVQRAAARP